MVAHTETVEFSLLLVSLLVVGPLLGGGIEADARPSPGDDAGSAEQKQITVEGRVLTATDSMPVEGATVTVHRHFGDSTLGTASTEADGRYRLAVPVEEESRGLQKLFRVEAHAEGFARTQEMIGSDTSAIELDLTLERAEPSISISSLEELRKIGRASGYPLDADYVLTQDIDASATAEWNEGRGFVPIGYNEEGTSTRTPFTGTFDGRGHTISGLTINRPQRNEEGGVIGFFSKVKKGTIKNLTLSDVSVAGNYTVGGLIGHSVILTVVENCTVTGEVRGWTDVGGLIGNSEFTTVQASETEGTITAPTGPGPRKVSTFSSAGHRKVGGLVGRTQYSMIHNSQSAIDFEAPDQWGVEAVGGVVGVNGVQSQVRHSHATGSLELVETFGDNTTEATAVGGLAGQHAAGDALIYAAYATGPVEATMNAGGLVGQNQGGTIRESYASGAVRGNSYVGGLTGENQGTVVASYASGTVFGSKEVGGLVGQNHGRVQRSFATGRVAYLDNSFFENEESIGGLVGEGRSTSPAGQDETTSEGDDRLVSSYWDRDATGQEQAYGEGSAARSKGYETDDDFARGLTTDQMSGESARENMAWLDFEATWRTVPGGYPVLQWESRSE